MITEDYVSFETAKLLKEKGFNEWCYKCYGTAVYHKGVPISFDEECDLKDEGLGDEIEYIEGGHLYDFGCDNRKEDENLYAAPTLWEAMKWLRKKYNLHVITLPYAPIDRHPYHPGEADIVYIAQLFRGIIPIDEIGRSVIKLTPEEAYEAAIKYCLENLI